MRKLMIIVVMISFSSLAFAGGEVYKTSFYSKALNESRWVNVYLPEGYDSSGSTLYPVVYWLNGGAVDPDYYVKHYLVPSLDSVIANKEIQPVILAIPDPRNGDEASWYTNSIITGNYADYIVHDLVEFIETNYKAIPLREKRCIMGHSLGGFGCMKLALQYPHIYQGVASHSGVLDKLKWYEWYFPGVIKENDPNGYGPPYTYDPNAGSNTKYTFYMCEIFSPNLSNPPYNVDFILDPDGEIDPDVKAIWDLNNPPYLATVLPPDADLDIYFDCGIYDEARCFPLNEAFHELLKNLGISHEYHSYTGSHKSHLAERIEIALKFLDSAMNETILGTDTQSIPECTGGVATFYLTAGWDNADRNYMLLGSVTGTDPGTPLPGGQVVLPLNWDIFTNVVIEYSNTSLFSNFTDSLDGTGFSTATLDTLGPIPGAVGLTLHFAYALNNPWDFVSNPVGIEILP